MPTMPSKIHGSKNWWSMVYHECGKGEKSHIHVEHRDVKLVFLITPDKPIIIHDNNKATNAEKIEILKVLREFMIMYNIEQNANNITTQKTPRFDPKTGKRLPSNDSNIQHFVINPNYESKAFKIYPIKDPKQLIEKEKPKEIKVERSTLNNKQSLRIKLIELCKQAKEILLNSKNQDNNNIKKK